MLAVLHGSIWNKWLSSPVLLVVLAVLRLNSTVCFKKTEAKQLVRQGFCPPIWHDNLCSFSNSILLLWGRGWVGKCVEDARGCCPFYHWYTVYSLGDVNNFYQHEMKCCLRYSLYFHSIYVYTRKRLLNSSGYYSFFGPHDNQYTAHFLETTWRRLQ